MTALFSGADKQRLGEFFRQQILAENPRIDRIELENKVRSLQKKYAPPINISRKKQKLLLSSEVK